MRINRKSGKKMKGEKTNLDLGPNLDWLAGQPVQIWRKK
jgi:hypothetical protein